MFLPLILMLFLGLTQILIALVGLTSRNVRQRRHFAHYLIGVLIYAGVLAIAVQFRPEVGFYQWTVLFFFMGALGLSVYNFVILLRPNSLAGSEETYGEDA
ncbi:MAG: hypothetical protein AAGN35_21200 [Bacteroidota bacterium]